MDCGNPVVPLLSPQISHYLRQLHEDQQGQVIVKHNGSLSGSFPFSNGVKQECALAPNFFSITFRDAKEGLQDGILIRFRTYGSLYFLRRLLARTKTIEELISEPLFPDDCALLAHTEEIPQHIVDLFSSAAKNLGFIISLNKTESLYQPPPREAYQHRWHQP